jgi:hypothetical protein
MHRVHSHCKTPAGLMGDSVTSKDANDEAGAQHTRSPVAAGLLSLVIYIAMYLTVAGALRVLTPADAVAVAPNGPTDGYALHRTE